jgi:dTDP-4-amino-4,6-dideoxy-D-galactose acyltransferase
MLPVQLLPWDSQFLGFGVARVAAENLQAGAWLQLQAKARAATCRLLYVAADPDDATTAATLAAAGLLRISRLVTYHADAAALVRPAAGPVVQPTTEMTPALEALAWESGAYSRFQLDPQMPPAAFRAMYSEWLRKSLRGEELARQVFSARFAEGPEVGLLTLGEEHGLADIGLLSVAAGARGQGIGRQLLATAGARARAWGFDRVQVVTQFENQAACRFYVRSGFEAVQQQDLYHCWLC